MAQALVGCLICSSHKFRTVEEEQLRALQNVGACQLLCERCDRPTMWRFVEHERRVTPDKRQALAPTALPPSVEKRDTHWRSEQQRTNRRIPLQLPVRIRFREFDGFEEVTKTNNVCKGGIYVHSQKPYYTGMKVMVALNLQEVGSALEQSGCVVRIDSLPRGPQGIAIALN